MNSDMNKPEKFGHLHLCLSLYSTFKTKSISKNNVSFCITFRNFPKVPFLLNSHAATESTAATYTERTK